ncbi:PA domain-containing protein [Microdochium nivale]|nr:PA domain-containing protein [Microdochium nivale]
MRPPRIAILAFFFGACLFILGRAVASATIRSTTPVAAANTALPVVATSHLRSLSSLFSFSTPFILFPPNAIITIADDNTTTFAARPAAFGPPLPTHGLTGQLWIGSGFTEENLLDGEGEGERGCSDAPNWDDGTNSVFTPLALGSKLASGGGAGRHSRHGPADSLKDSIIYRMPASGVASKSKPVPITLDDGTDDYLHQGLGGNPIKQTQSDAFGLAGIGHADIQSIQEGAEIAGKIVLLSRGGCGFLEKAKWAQRRGAVALIVGDNQRGGPLIQMFAKGDTSNVTIPSIFTSRTTAYLLSLMLQSGAAFENVVDDHGKLALKAQPLDKTAKNKNVKDQGSAPTSSSKGSLSTGSRPSTAADGSSGRSGWLDGLFGWATVSDSGEAGSRPPSSGRLEWEQVEDFSDENDVLPASKLKKMDKSTKSTSQSTPDDFQIGVQDWRDPDLIGYGEGQEAAMPKGSSKAMKSFPAQRRGDMQAKPQDPDTITPSSGEYIASNFPPKEHDAIGKSKDNLPTTKESPGGLISKLFGAHDSSASVQEDVKPAPITPPAESAPGPTKSVTPPHREGLWVVITPSSGATPFFDTLLVLVISPLITLTVVYALLILRARIRRRRWRAPKSVVERLPVRTYQTVATSSSQNSRLPSPNSSSPTTPLLQSSELPPRPRPRSRTTTGVVTADEVLQAEAAHAVPRSALPRGPQVPEHEKRGSQWKKYMGRQVECVVCLEEYVDGVSQVMSLPCGHEFHVDCM